jgi:hypothetical protein
MALLISYDLNGHERPGAYDAVKRVIERSAADYRRPLYSQWLVETAEPVSVWADRLIRAMDRDDRLLITRVQQPVQGWLDQATWDWLNARI